MEIFCQLVGAPEMKQAVSGDCFVLLLMWRLKVGLG